MRKSKKIPVNRYLYASGRIRALEVQLLDLSRLSRLDEARSIEDVNRVLNDSNYPAAPDPETRLSLEMTTAIELVRSLLPEKAFIETLLIFHDYHNLKVILKNLTAAWPKQKPAEEMSQTDNLPEAAGPFALANPADLEPYFLRPVLVDPQVMFVAIRDRDPSLIPADLYAAAVKAVKRYQNSYDISDIDLLLDQTAFARALDKADQIGNVFFTQYLQMQIDQTNLGLLLRTRFLQSGQAYLERSLLTGGTLPTKRIIELYSGTAEQITAEYASTVFAKMAAMAADYGQPGTAARFSLLADNLIIEHITQAKLLWRGPEIPLAYLIARLMEIKNIRIVLTCLRNGLPAGQAREMNRDRYMTWR